MSSKLLLDVSVVVGKGLVMFSSADPFSEAAIDLLASARGKMFGTILAAPPWQFQNRTGKIAVA
jgi:hypothetical protein